MKAPDRRCVAIVRLFAGVLAEMAVLSREECIVAEGAFLAAYEAAETARDAMEAALDRCRFTTANAEEWLARFARAEAGDIEPDLLADIAAGLEAELCARIDVAFPPDDAQPEARAPWEAA